MRRPWIVTVSILLTIALFVRSQAPEPLRTAGDRLVDIKHLRLDLKVNLPKQTVDAIATFDLRATRPDELCP